MHISLKNISILQFNYRKFKEMRNFDFYYVLLSYIKNFLEC